MITYDREGNPQGDVPDGAPLPDGRYASPPPAPQNQIYLPPDDAGDEGDDGNSDSWGHPNSFSNPIPPPASPARDNPAPAMSTPNIGDSSHKYVGTDGRGDVYQVFDASQNRVLEWAVQVGHDSRDMIPGSLRDLGPPSGGASLGHVTGDPSHRYVGTDARGDVYQLFDAANNRVLEWAVAPGTDSRGIIDSTLRDLGPPSGGTVAQANPNPVTQEGRTAAPPTVTNPQGTPGATRTNAVNTLPPSTSGTVGNAVQGDPRHKFVRRQGNVDTWQIFDGNVVKEWDVPAGHDSRELIFGSLRDVGLPGPNTVAQNDGYQAVQPPSPKVNYAINRGDTGGAGGSDAGISTVVIGAGILVLKLLVAS